jgi:hypothetical protein
MPAYQLKFQEPIVNIELCPWFQKSYDSIEDNLMDVDIVDRKYEKKFGVKLIYGTPESKDAIKPILAVEFPSKSEAVLFVLKWS